MPDLSPVFAELRRVMASYAAIGLRPPEVDQCLTRGNWEADLVERSRNDSAARTFIERTSRYAMLARLDGGDTQSVLESFTKRLRTVPASLRKTVAYDQGTGTSPRETLAKRLKMDIDFCNPHGPWQRTADENANGLIRESLPKDTDLSAVANAELRAIEAGLNGRPRQMLRLESPGENFSSLKLNEFIGVALQA